MSPCALQMPQRTPTPEGVLDARLGVSNKRSRCATCGLGLKECAGHFGFVKLPLPVFHPVCPFSHLFVAPVLHRSAS